MAIIERDGGVTPEASDGIRRLFVLMRIDYAVLAVVIADMTLKPTRDDVGVLVGMAAVVAIVAVQPGADPSDMEQTVAKPIEDVLRGIDNIDEIISRSVDGSRTTNLSLGERPVCWPVRHTSGPSEASTPSCRRSASS